MATGYHEVSFAWNADAVLLEDSYYTIQASHASTCAVSDVCVVGGIARCLVTLFANDFAPCVMANHRVTLPLPPSFVLPQGHRQH